MMLRDLRCPPATTNSNFRRSSDNNNNNNSSEAVRHHASNITAVAMVDPCVAGPLTQILSRSGDGEVKLWDVRKDLGPVATLVPSSHPSWSATCSFALLRDTPYLFVPSVRDTLDVVHVGNGRVVASHVVPDLSQELAEDSVGEPGIAHAFGLSRPRSLTTASAAAGGASLFGSPLLVERSAFGCVTAVFSCSGTTRTLRFGPSTGAADYNAW